MRYLMTALLGLVLLGTTVPAIAEGPTWCGDGNYSAAHPLAWEQFSGEVEVLVNELTVLNRSETPPIHHDEQVNE